MKEAVSILQDEIPVLTQQPIVPYSAGIPGFQVHNKCVLGVDGLQGLVGAVKGIQYYDQRALSIAASDDLVILSGESYDEAYVAWLYSVGLGTHPDNIFLIPQEGYRSAVHRFLDNEALILQLREKIDAHKEKTGKMGFWHPFFYSTDEKEVALSLGLKYFGCKTHVVKSFNDKAYFKEMCQEIGISTAPGGIVYRYRRGMEAMNREIFSEALLRQLQRFGRVFIRGNCGASGSSQRMCTFDGSSDSSNFTETVQWMLDDVEMDAFLIERDCKPLNSPSIMFRILPDWNIYRLSPLGGQLLVRKEHAGNYYPAKLDKCLYDAAIQQGVQIAFAMRDRKFIGDFGVDFMVTDTGSLYPVEVNPRNTGQTPMAHFYAVVNRVRGQDSVPFSAAVGLTEAEMREELVSFPPSLIQYFQLGDTTKDYVHMMSVNVETDFLTFAELKESLGNLLYVPGRSWGVVPMNLGPLSSVGKFSMVIFAETQKDYRTLALLAAKRVGMKNLDVLV